MKNSIYKNENGYKISYSNCWKIGLLPQENPPALSKSDTIMLSKTSSCPTDQNLENLEKFEYLIIERHKYHKELGADSKSAFDKTSKDSEAVYYKKQKSEIPFRLQIKIFDIGGMRWEYSAFCKKYIIDIQFGFNSNDRSVNMDLKNAVKAGNPSIPTEIQSVIDSLKCI